jgi:hypothetical protein
MHFAHALVGALQCGLNVGADVFFPHMPLKSSLRHEPSGLR